MPVTGLVNPSLRGQLAGQASMSFGAGLVESGDLDGLALAFVLRGDGVERGYRRRVPDVRGGEVDDGGVGSST